MGGGGLREPHTERGHGALPRPPREQFTCSWMGFVGRGLRCQHRTSRGDAAQHGTFPEQPTRAQLGRVGGVGCHSKCRACRHDALPHATPSQTPRRRLGRVGAESHGEQATPCAPKAFLLAPDEHSPCGRLVYVDGAGWCAEHQTGCHAPLPHPPHREPSLGWLGAVEANGSGADECSAGHAVCPSERPSTPPCAELGAVEEDGSGADDRAAANAARSPNPLPAAAGHELEVLGSVLERARALSRISGPSGASLGCRLDRACLGSLESAHDPVEARVRLSAMHGASARLPYHG